MAGRIPQPFIDELLTRTDIVALIDRYVPLKRSGVNYQACCPFHQEKTPSFSVNGNKQFYYCFGCGAGGNAISFMMNYLNYSFIETLENLSSQCGMTVPRQTETTERQRLGESLYVLMDQVTTFYQQQLSGHDSAKRYLSEQRGLSAEIIDKFRLGYAPSGWGGLLKQFEASQHEALIKAGMVIKRDELDCYDRFRRRIMFPIRDRRGHVVAFGGRIVDEGTPKYLNSPETAIFHKSSELYGLYELLQRRGKVKGVMVVEGYMDVIALAQQGIHYAVATLGTAVTPNHLQRLFSLCDNILFCFDGDSAGRRAAWRVVEVVLPLLQDSWQVRFLFLPEGEDPDALVRREGKEAFESRLSQGKTLSQFLLHHFATQVNMDSLDDRARFAHLAIGAVNKVASPLMKQLLMEAVSEMSRIDVATLDQTATQQQSARHQSQPARKQTAVRQIGMTLLRRAIALLIQYPSLAQSCQTLPEISGSGGKLLNMLFERLKENPALSSGALIEHWRDQPEESYLVQLANSEATLLTAESAIMEEFNGIIAMLKRDIKQQRIEALYSKLQQRTITAEEKHELRRLLELEF
ncbi:MAG: DNA primase [Gammaproteobacteria bacterium]|nr:DNA primase [Gammaproteobacteria bacterium]